MPSLSEEDQAKKEMLATTTTVQGKKRKVQDVTQGSFVSGFLEEEVELQRRNPILALSVSGVADALSG